jgi:glycosyltransferase involved in cell wall biosynthesis
MASGLSKIVDGDARVAALNTGRPRHVCMLAYAFYESDTRILQYTSALVQKGDLVDVFALRRGNHAPAFEVLNGVNVYRIQTRTLDEKGLFSYVSRILRFLLRSAFVLRKKHREHPYDLVHVHNVPDFLVFAAFFPKATGVPVILDIHDLLPEFYVSKFKVAHGSVWFTILTLVERCCAGFANRVIVANHLWRDRLVIRSVQPEKCTVVRNYPDLDIFIARPREAKTTKDRFLFTYPGSLNWHQGLDVAIRAFARIADQIPEAQFHIYGEGPAKLSLMELANELHMQDRIIFHDFLPSKEIAEVMAMTDIAIEPKRATSAFGNEALSTKILEFMALGIPVIASKTKIHAHYYDDSIIQYYENDDDSDLARQILRLKHSPELCHRLVMNANKYVRENNWNSRKQDYLQLVDSLVRHVV